MAYDPEQAPSATYADQTSARRDVAALLLIVVGVIGLVTCAFWQDTLLGAAALSALTIGAGVGLGVRR